ncbi:MAG: YabP/YqfC family sporulation protein [Oscillospiraceae bacterium]|nr:YabP/YqfC family sporulation protein [Oscillospiraceae bacterium]
MGIKSRLIRLTEVHGEMLVTLSGSREVCVENCTGITCADENCAVLCSEKESIRVTGTALVLESYGAYGVKITGRIHSVTLEDME